MALGLHVETSITRNARSDSDRPAGAGGVFVPIGGISCFMLGVFRWGKPGVQGG